MDQPKFSSESLIRLEYLYPMKKQFNKKKFESRPRREGERKNNRGSKPDWKKRDEKGGDNREQRGSRYDERRNEGDKQKRFSDKREWEKDSRSGGDKNQRGNRYGERRGSSDKEKRFSEKRDWKKDTGRSYDKAAGGGGYGYRGSNERRDEKPWEKRGSWSGNRNKFGGRKPYGAKREENLKKAFDRSKKIVPGSSDPTVPAGGGLIRLNKYLSNAGICSRREADTFISAGVVSVNGKIITELGYKVSPSDKVQFGGNKVHKEKTVYILLNKPKGYITTCDDPDERDTVMDLIRDVPERVYPVGRLDRHTSGLLLLTNDGELAKILMHPKYQVPKVYHVELDKPLRAEDLEKIRTGIELEDGFIKPDDIAYVDGAATKKEVGIEIHSGRNRIVRRIFESLGYIVMKLDRVFYAGLTKQTLSRGKWRFLAENEVRMLKRNK